MIYYEKSGLQGGHNSILHSLDSIAYQNEISNRLERLKTQNNGKLSNEDEAAFYKTVDHDLYSEVNQELMDKIMHMFHNAI